MSSSQKNEISAWGLQEMPVLIGLTSWFITSFLVKLVSRIPATPWSLTMLVLGALACLGSRWSFRVSPDGIQLAIYRAWVLPVYKQRWTLDASVEVVEGLLGQPSGLLVHPAMWAPKTLKAPRRFGPRFGRGRVLAMQARLLEAVERMRKLAPPPPRELRHPLLARHAAALDLAHARWDQRGRLRQVTALADLWMGILKLPAGTVLFFNFSEDEAYMDPRQHDVLREVVLGGPSALFGIKVRAGARARFYPNGRVSSVRGAFARMTCLQGVWVDGQDVLAFDEDHELTAFTLAAPGKLGGHTYPPGSRFRLWPSTVETPKRWTCWLGGELKLPEVTLQADDGCELAPGNGELYAISPQRDVRIGDVVLRHGIVPFPVTPDGHIELEQCKALGLLRTPS
jgi:hypothetical protein